MIAKGQKEEALGLQMLVDDCSDGFLQRLVKICSINIESLVNHPTGNFLIPKIIKRDQIFSKFAIKFCQKNFKRLTENEYSSRVLQFLIQSYSEFSLFAINQFRKNLPAYIQHFSSAVLVSVSIYQTEFDQESDFILDELTFGGRKILCKKFFKRALVAYIANCSMESLETLFYVLQRLMFHGEYFKERYSCLMLLGMAERGLHQALDFVATSIQCYAADCLKMPTFKFFLERIIENPKLAELAQLISQSFKRLSRQSLGRIHENSKAYAGYVKALYMFRHL